MTQATLSRDIEGVPQPRSERSLRSLLRALEIDTRLLGMIVALAVVWIALPDHVGRPVPDVAQPVEPVGSELVHRHHGDGHGAHHRLAQHRPVGRVAARLPWLHDGHGADAMDSERASPRLQPAVYLACRAGGWRRGGRADRWFSGPDRRLRRGSVVHRHAGRLPGLARTDLRLRAGADARADGRHVCPARRRPERVARRDRQLDRRRRGVRRHRVHAGQQSPPAPRLRLSRAADLGVGDGHRRRLRSRSSGRSGWPTATCGRTRLRTSTRSRTALPSRRAD